jgi:hypothetical protein
MRLFAVNAGSGSVSMFKIKPGGITLLGTSPSEGQYPVTPGRQRRHGLRAQRTEQLAGSVHHHQQPSQLRANVRAPCGAAAARPAVPGHSEQPVATKAPGQIGLSPDGGEPRLPAAP